MLGGFCTFLLAFAQDRWLSAPDTRPQHQRSTAPTATCSQGLRMGTRTHAQPGWAACWLPGELDLVPSSFCHFLSISFLWNGGYRSTHWRGPWGCRLSPSSALSQGPHKEVQGQPR